MKKVCPSCKLSKNLSEYHIDKSTKLGVKTYCKVCSNLRRRKDKERSLEIYHQKYSGTPLQKYRSIVSNAPRRKISINITSGDFCNWYSKQEKKCSYCERILIQGKRGNDGLTVDRIDNNIGYELGNILLCCWRCNVIKGWWFSHNEMIEIANKYLKGKERLKN